MKDISIVFMGTSEFSVPVLERLVDDGYQIPAVVSQPDKPQGRKRKRVPSPVKRFSIARGLNLRQPEKIRTKAFYAYLESLSPDIIVTASYGKILSKRHISIPKYGILNVHASLLPELRGAAPIAWAIIRGYAQSGVTIMKTDVGLDTGDILSQRSIAITSQETRGTLEKKLSMLGAELLSETIPAYVQGKIIPSPQDHSLATYAPKIRPEDGAVCWSDSAKKIHRLIRGLNPSPGAYTSFNGKRVKIYSAEIVDDNFPGAPGEIVRVVKNKGIIVRTGEGCLLCMELQPASKKRMRGDLLVVGRYFSVNDVFNETPVIQ